MKNTHCVICGEKFDTPRLKKLYCSDSCKSQAYLERKKGKENELNINQVPVSGSIQPDYIFDRAEFKLLGKISGLSFVGFCFFRKNLKGKFTTKYLKDYLEDIKDSHKDSLSEEEWSGKLKERFDEFLFEFYSSKTQIIDTSIIEEKTEDINTTIIPEENNQ